VLRRRHLCALLAATFVLAAPAAAQAGTLSVDGTTAVYSEADGDMGQNGVQVFVASSGNHFLREEVDSVSGTGCTNLGSGFWDCGPNITAWRITLGGGNDQLTGYPLLPGITAASIPITVDGGPGSDTLTGGEAGDLIDGGIGNDNMSGGSGTDVVTYASRTVGVNVDRSAGGAAVNGSSEDGSPGARDIIHAADVEGVIGSGGADLLRGSATAELLDGGPGDDNVNPLAGADTVRGGAGVDNIEARDGEPDGVDCGPDEDVATTDPADTRANCDAAPVAPGGGTTTTIFAPVRVLFDIGYSFTAGRRGTVLRALRLDVESGSRLTARCRTRRGRRCVGIRDVGASRAVTLRGFQGKRLPVGAKLTIQVTKDGAIGAVKTLTIRRRRAPSVRTLCLPPGAARPVAC
jgi:Ca2+-binding RTX toxin-like protein